MQRNQYIPLSLIAATMFAGCSTIPPANTALSEAHSSYDSARGNAQVTRLAPLELQEAGATLDKADAASTGREDEATVNQLAYLARQKVAIAQETAKRKAAEMEIANASAKRDQVRLEARTAEADAARKRAENAQLAANQQAERDKALIAARMAELEQAKKQAALAKEAADKQAAALAEASAQSKQDQALIAARMAEAEEAKKQAAMAQEAADKQAAALAEAKAEAERVQARLAEQDMQLKALQAKKTDRGMVITLGDVLFNVNKANLSAGGINNVKKLAAFLEKYPQRKVMIEGHTDSRGSDSYNQALSERRADAVKTALVDMGISGERVTTRGYGESSPVATNDTAAGRQMNRRVEIILSDDSGNIVPR